MALVYNSIEIPYGTNVVQSVAVPLVPRIRQSYSSSYNMLGPVAKSTEVTYDIINYVLVSQSVEVPYAGRVATSTTIPYDFEQRVLQSIAITVPGKSKVYTSVLVACGIPGYTRVLKSTRVLCRFHDQTFIQPTVAVKVTK